MNEFRKLMEAIEAIEEAGYGDEWCDDCGQGRDQCRCNEVSEDNYYGGGHVKSNTREATVSLHQLMDEGMLDARTVADAALQYMSEAEVKDMAESEGFFGDE